jgi:CRP-like cAMP-binding protein
MSQSDRVFPERPDPAARHARARSGAAVLRLCPGHERRLAGEIRKRMSTLEHRRVPGREHLFHEGDAVDRLSVIERGLIALRRGTCGRQRVAMLLRDGGVLGDVPLITGSPAAFDAVAVVDTDVVSMSAAEFWQLIGQCPEFAQRWVAHSACRMSGYQNRLLDLLAGDVRSQVASLLLHEFAGAGSRLLTQQMIADLLGVQRSSVSRVMHHLERHGAIKMSYARLKLLDRAALARAAQGYTPGSKAGSA